MERTETPPPAWQGVMSEQSGAGKGQEQRQKGSMRFTWHNLELHRNPKPRSIHGFAIRNLEDASVSEKQIHPRRRRSL